jgi:hypothetical protein
VWLKIESLLCKCEALGSKLQSTPKNKKNRTPVLFDAEFFRFTDTKFDRSLSVAMV